MTLDLLDQMGLTGFDYSYVFIGLAAVSILLLILVFVQMVQIAKLKKKYKKFMSGKDAKSLENQIEKLFEDNKTLVNYKNNNDILKDVNFKYICGVNPKRTNIFNQSIVPIISSYDESLYSQNNLIKTPTRAMYVDERSKKNG